MRLLERGIRRLTNVLLISAALSFAQGAAAQELKTVDVQLGHLIKGEVEHTYTADADVKAAAAAGTCLLNGTPIPNKPRAVTIDLKSLADQACSTLRGYEPAKTNVSVKIGDGKFLHLSLVPQRLPAETVKLVAAEDGLQVLKDDKPTALPPSTNGTKPKVSWWDAARGAWREQEAVDGKITVPRSLTGGGTQGQLVYVNFTSDAVIAAVNPIGARIVSGKAPTDTTDTARRDGEQPAGGQGNTHFNQWCQPGGQEEYWVCIDLAPPKSRKPVRPIQYSPKASSHILPPNTSLHVIVRKPAGTELDVQLGGEQGLYVSADRNLVSPPPTEGKLQADVDAVDIESADFAPRLPGKANLTVTLTTKAGKEETRTIEFLVDTTYIGAVRLGAAMVFGGATDRAYEARAINGSAQSEIVASKEQDVDVELVLGYSAYLSPRSYAQTDLLRFEPYVGIGVLNDSPTGLETLKSLHAGLEWEPSPNFGIAATFVVRRVTRLQDGVRVGSPVDSSSVPTVERADWGLGLVFNLSPEFFRISRSSGSSFFK